MTSPHSQQKTGTMEAYCVKCRLKRQMKDAHRVILKNGKPADEGICPSCGTRLYRIGRR